MKTNVVMKRQLDGIIVEQNSKDGMFNATSFLKQYSKNSKIKKEVADFLKIKKTKEFISAISDSENVDMKKVVSVKRGGAKKEQGTLMHPYLFIDFAMWLNPTFKVKVIKFVYDELIKNRNLAGDNYILMQSSVGTLKGCDFIKVAKAINYIVFGKHSKGLRQTANQDQLSELNKIQGNLSFAIDSGLIQNYPQLISHLRRMWHDKNAPNVLKTA